MTTSTTVPRLSFVTIRPATDDDLAAIESLLTSSHLPIAGAKETLCGFLVAEADDRVVGVVGMEPCGNYGLLRSTAVAADWRGHRVARHPRRFDRRSSSKVPAQHRRR